MDVVDRTSITGADDAAHLGSGDIDSSMFALIEDDHADEKARRDHQFAPAFFVIARRTSNRLASMSTAFALDCIARSIIRSQLFAETISVLVFGYQSGRKVRIDCPKRLVRGLIA
jgi:hypothetical protein